MEPFDFDIIRVEWAPIVRQAAGQQNAKGLPRPEGLPARGRYTLMRSCMAGHVRYSLYYRPTGLRAYIAIGRFSLKREQPVEPKKRYSAGIQVGRVIQLECGRMVRVQVDAQGLPYPVPVL